MLQLVARIERSEMRDSFVADVPDFATLNPGYELEASRAQ
jgi:hypothetical protein